MEWTIRINGPGPAPGTNTLGTGFLLLKRTAPQAQTGRVMLITAAHVLAEISGTEATLNLRQKVSESEWKPLPVQLRIRDGSKPLWTQHPTQDVAVEYCSIPPAASFAAFAAFADEVLATDEAIKRLGVHPGDDISALGYPYGYSSDFDFPILRTGTVATYPLLPLKQHNIIGFDFNVLPGNSGGPVFFYNASGTRSIAGGVSVGGPGFALLGLVSAMKTPPDGAQIPPGASKDIGLALVVNSAVIQETIDRLPPSP